MKRWLITALMILVFCAPALAQQASVDPAAYLPASAAAYLEVRTDADALDAYGQLASLGFQLSGAPTSLSSTPVGVLISLGISGVFPGVDFTADIQPWLGDRIAVSASSLPAGMGNFVAVLPIIDQAGARAFVTKVTGGAAPDTSASVPVYTVGRLKLAVGAAVIWMGTPDAVAEAVGAADHLADNPAYQKLRAALPADAQITAFVSGKALADAVAQQEAFSSPGSPSPDALMEAALRLHPAQSAAEDALLKFPPLDGIGAAFESGSDGLHLTAALSVDAQYLAPTLTTATAGAGLLDLLPADSFAVFDSYDLSATILPVAALALLGPSVGGTFSSITTSIDGTPLPTPTATPTPTPEPPVTADTIIAQAQPILAQAASLMGMSLDEFYRLIDGEYAVAVFPGAGPTIGAALYLQSSDPQRLIDTLDHVSSLILTNPTTGAQLVTPTQTSIDGVDLTLLAVPDLAEPLALGILDDHVLFLTLESLASKVIDAAAAKDQSAPALHWRDAFGTGQEALFYADLRTIDLYSLRVQRVPPLPIQSVAGSLDVADNGLFLLRLTATLGN